MNLNKNYYKEKQEFYNGGREEQLVVQHYY